jgi:S-adenosylmethionine-diacylgycerolhomoserine-N-methlytransferase
LNDAAIKMDRMYRWKTGLYDLTRRYYLLGREHAIRSIAPPAGANVLEIGCGTGRNLVKAAQVWPDARFFGTDISKAMLAKAHRSVAKQDLAARITLAQADATNFNPHDMFGGISFQRIYFSYTLSMIPDWEKALDQALAILPPGGVLLITDFGDFDGIPSLFRRLLLGWLSVFSVTPHDEFEPVFRERAAARGFQCEFSSLYFGYAFLAKISRAE